jgi:hypothetical protein
MGTHFINDDPSEGRERTNPENGIDLRRPLVLFRNRVFGANPIEHMARHELRGHFTIDQRRLKDADVVVFHIPDITFAGVPETRKYPGQLWVAWSMECKVNYPALSNPSFMRFFDLTMTYERRSDVWIPYLPKLASWEHAVRAAIPPKRTDSPVVMFQSSGINR